MAPTLPPSPSPRRVPLITTLQLDGRVPNPTTSLENFLKVCTRDHDGTGLLSEVSNDELLAEIGVHAGALDFSGRPVEFEPPESLELTQIAEQVCQRAQFRICDLRSRSRTRELAALRKEFVSLAVDAYGHAIGDVAAFLRKHPGSVSRWIETPTRPCRLGPQDHEGS